MKSEYKYSLKEALIKLEAYCAYQDRCTFDVRKKLNNWSFSEDDQETLIHQLRKSRFLDDQRFASSYVSGKYRIKRWGRIKIRTELKVRKIPSDFIQSALSEIDQEVYWDNILGLARRKWREQQQKKGDDYKKKAAVCRFLSSKGYETDLVLDAVHEAFNELESSGEDE